MSSEHTSARAECPDENTLVGLLERAGDSEERARFERHVEGCERCYELWSALALAADSRATDRASVDTAYAMTQLGNGPPARHRRDSAPARLGRYLVIEQLGAGGMGVVFAAYDPELDRKVAIKLVHPQRNSDEERARLLREARALAQLSHKSVVSVFDVGTLDDDVFIAMEFVDGVTLRAWRDAAPRSWRATLEVYLDAGAGLAAAHAAGLVHRDFKPQNAMIARDGTVKVLDFGLARVAVDERAATTPGALGDTEELTRTGALVGTPAYMSPEQFERARVDARSDQFSFCVALYEALYGAHPFPHEGFSDLCAAVLRGDVRGPSRREQVGLPATARRALLRGLSREPADRFETMDELLDALRRDPAGPRRRIAAGVTVLAVAGGAVIAGRWSPREPVCSSGQAQARAVWGDEATRSALAERFAASSLPYAERAWTEVARQLDAYAEGWAAMRDDSCRATRVRGEQSGELLDLRAACLDRRLDELAALVGAFRRSPALDAVVEGSVQAVESLRGVEACANASALRAVIPPPEDARARGELETTRGELAEIKALLLSGQVTTARPRAAVAVARAEELDYLPLVAEARLVLGRALARDGEPGEAVAQLRRALADALAAGDDLGVTESASELVNTYAEGEGDPARAREWVPIAEAALQRAGGDAELEARLRLYQGWAQARAGDHGAARATLGAIAADPRARRDSLLALRAEFSVANTFLMAGEPAPALEIYEALRPRFERTLDASHPYLAVVLDNTATAYGALGRLNDARAAYRRAFEIRARALGPEHTELVNSLVNMSTVASEDAGDASEESLLLRAAALLEGRPDDPRQASIHNNLGLIYDDRDPARALEHFQRACDNITRRLGARHPDQFNPRVGIGHAHFKAGRYARALAAYQEAESIARAAHGGTHRRVGVALRNQAEVLQEQGARAEAEGLFRQALAVFESVDAPDATRVEALLQLAELELARGDDAAATIEKVQAIVDGPSFVAEAEHDGWSARRRAEGMFLIARATVDEDRDGARRRAQTAQALLRAQAPDERAEALRAEVKAWLRAHR